MPDVIEPRELVRRSLDQSAHLIGSVPVDRFGDPTPCGDFDIRSLVGHMTFAAGRLAMAGRREHIIDEPAVITGVADADWATTFGAAAGRAVTAWAADDALEGEIEVPFGTFPADLVALIYVEEQVTHGWDLAVATGQWASLDPALAEVILPVVQQYVPAEGRGDALGFGPVVEVPDSTPVYDRLAAYLGRNPVSGGPATGR
jgi:uncharacterized protein (TIGR03086 family)